MNAFPRTLILSEDALAPSHGTGAILLRTLSEVPRERLKNGYLNHRSPPVLADSHRLDQPEGFAALTRMLASGEIDFLYSTLFTVGGLRHLERLLQVCPRDVRVVHHALDIVIDDPDEYSAVLGRLGERFTQVWGGERAAAIDVARWCGGEAVEMNPLSCEILPLGDRSYRARGTKIVMLGNVHLPGLFREFLAYWRGMRARHPFLEPIAWYAHESTYARYRGSGPDFSPDLVYKGYLAPRDLQARLEEADLGLVLFNGQDEPEISYARYSIPSRMTEYACAGLPMFVAAGSSTDAYRYVNENGLGACATFSRRDEFSEKLLSLLGDEAQRRKLGRQARRFAETAFDVEGYRGRFKARLAKMGLVPPTPFVSD